jgi:hypothetical protein
MSLTAFPGNTKATPERVAHMLEEGIDPHDFVAVGEFLNMHPDAARRAMQKLGHVPPAGPRQFTSAEDVARIRQLGAEGMIAPFICEDVSVSEDTVKRVLGPRPEAALEWRRAWLAIRKNARMLELHYEISPRGKNMGKRAA